ncbi:MAG: MFS transporter [Candidatus Levyibacteriota bacterium]
MLKIAQGRHPTIAFVALCLGFFMTILDVTIVNVALVNIKEHIGGGLNALQWIIDGYALIFASLLLTTGALGDRIGNKRIFIAGLIMFTLSSILCGLAPTLWLLELGRIAQGFGAALLVPASLALINHTFPDAKKKASALGVYGAIGGFGATIGPVLGGVLINIFGWRSIFLVNVPFGILCLLLTTFFITESPTKKRGFDIPGQIAAIASLSLLTFSFIEGKGLGWHSPLILSALILFIIATMLFLMRELKTKMPMLPLSFFRNSTFSGANAVGFLSFFTLYGYLFILSLFFQQVQHYSPLKTGMALLPGGIPLFIASLFTGKLAGKMGVKIPILIGILFGCLGYAGLGLVNEGTPYIFIAIAMATIGLFMAFTIPPITVAVVTNVKKEHSGIASSIYNVSRQVGSILGVAILGSLIGSQGEFIQGMHIAFFIATAACLVSLFITSIWIKSKQ